MKFLKVLLIVLISPPLFALNLNPEDISILFPLPQDGSHTELIAASAPLVNGTTLLPQTGYKKMPVPLVQVTEGGFFPSSRESTFKDLRVVSVRIDPCFPGDATAAVPGCQPQIRLVFQVIRGQQAITTEDAAIHVLYDLTQPQFDTLIGELISLKKRHGLTKGSRTLDVHSELKEKGLKSEFAGDLKSLIVSTASVASLRQMTFMALSGSGNVWFFGGLLFKDGEVIGAPIPNVTSTRPIPNIPRDNKIPLQRISSVIVLHANQFSRSLIPMAEAGDNANFLAAIVNEERLLATPETRQKENLETLARLLNPRFTHPLNVDCASCHMAHGANQILATHFSRKSLENKNSFSMPGWNLGNVAPATKGDMNNFRLFGYKGTTPSISDRVVNETVLNLEQIRGK